VLEILKAFSHTRPGWFAPGARGVSRVAIVGRRGSSRFHAETRHEPSSLLDSQQDGSHHFRSNSS
jgi:hypothetical protein